MAWKRVRYPCKEHGSDFLERIKRQEERKGERGKERKKGFTKGAVAERNSEVMALWRCEHT